MPLIDLGPKPDTDRRPVIRPCTICGKDTLVASDHQGYVSCGAQCQSELDKQIRNAQSGIDKFIVGNPDYYPCDYNRKLIAELLDRWKKHPTAENIESAYLHLLATGKVLRRLTV